MTPKVIVTITSKLPEFDGRLNGLGSIIIEPGATWLDLFQYNGIQVDASKHRIKSSKHTAYIDDPIQETATHYARASFCVQIIRFAPSRKQPARPRVRVSDLLKPKPSNPGTSASSVNNVSGVSGGAAPGPKTSTPLPGARSPSKSASSGQSLIPKGTKKSKTTSARAGKNGTPKQPRKRVNKKTPLIAVAANPRSNRNATAAAQPAPVQNGPHSHGPGYGELNFATGSMPSFSQQSQRQSQQQRTLPQDPIIGGPLTYVPPANYAESQASQDSQPEEPPHYGTAKRTFLESFAKARSEDFENILHEIKRLKTAPEESRYRWQRKTPLAATLLFNWADRNP